MVGVASDRLRERERARLGVHGVTVAARFDCVIVR
jgi:hypothetical protein